MPADFIAAWATINEAFGGGWQPSEMDKMSIEDFCDWYDEAVARIKAKNAQIEKGA